MYRTALLAAAMAHMEGFYSGLSLAHRNKNPGNIENPDGHFKVFPDMVSGFKALCDDIDANQGLVLRMFIRKYAPPNENDTQNYLSVVCGITEMSPDELL